MHREVIGIEKLVTFLYIFFLFLFFFPQSGWFRVLPLTHFPLSDISVVTISVLLSTTQVLCTEEVLVLLDLSKNGTDTRG